MQKQSQESLSDRYPLLMESRETNENQEHVIDVEKGSNNSSAGPSHNNSFGGLDLHHSENRPSSSVQLRITQSPSYNDLDSRSSSVTRREEQSNHLFWSPFNIILWLSIEIVVTAGQIIAAIVVLSISSHEKPKTPLFAWIVGYAVGCTVSIPVTCWRYLIRSWVGEQESAQLHQDSSQLNSTSEPNSSITISLTQTMEEENGQITSSSPQNGQTVGAPNVRLGLLILRLKMALDFFFLVWFIVGNIWIFGGHSSSSDAPNLYRLCIVFLTFSCIGYAMPLILCTMICCCLPCIISFLGVQDDTNQMRGASEETINALPMHKFKLKDKGSHGGPSSSGVDEGGLVAVGTEKERFILGEDAVCCICLERYSDNDDLRELPCSHFFHSECVDTWLKMNASCPLCKFEIDKNNMKPSAENSAQQV